jgi:hypothetical protein
MRAQIFLKEAQIGKIIQGENNYLFINIKGLFPY